MHLITPRGRERLISRQRELEAQLAAVLREKGAAAENGGNQWHDNFSFEACEQQERMIRWRINELQICLSLAIIVEPTPQPGKVGIGSRVEIELDDRSVTTISIGGHWDSDPEASLVAYDAPLGQAIFGAEAGDERNYRVGPNQRNVFVRSVRP